MGNPRILADNILSVAHYSNVVLTPSEEFEGTGTGQAFRVADGRRESSAWTGTSTNTEYSLKRNESPLIPRPYDMVVVDRASVITRLIAEDSDDNFTSDSDAFDITLPTAPGTGMLTDALGVRTTEGAWMKRIDTRGASYWRARIPAMGSGLKPIIYGLYVGLSWSPDFVLRPWAPKRTVQRGEWMETRLGGVGTSKLVPRREGVLQLQMPDLFLGEQGAYHLSLIDQGTPFWIIPDDERAELAFLARRRPDLAGLGLEPGWFYEQGAIPYIEHFPDPRSTVNV